MEAEDSKRERGGCRGGGDVYRREGGEREREEERGGERERERERARERESEETGPVQRHYKTAFKGALQTLSHIHI